jgi:hypothetical protein
LAAQADAETLRRELEVRHDALLAAQADAEALRRELGHLREKFRSEEASRVAAQQALDAIIQSTSWRMMAPLRRIVSVARRISAPSVRTDGSAEQGPSAKSPPDGDVDSCASWSPRGRYGHRT